MSRRPPSQRHSNVPKGLIAFVVAVPIALGVLIVAIAILVAQPDSAEDPGAPAARDNRGRVVLTVAYTPEKAALFEQMVNEFNQKSERFSIKATKLEMDEMIKQARLGKFTAISPDSAIWLGPLDQAWLAEDSSRASIVGSLSRFALSPVVIAMWETRAADLGYPGKLIGWADIAEQATSASGLRWSHPSTSTAAGLLATTAEFYAASGKTSHLTSADLADPKVQDYVRKVERTIQRYGGESEDVVVDRLLSQGSRNLDAFVGQEASVVRYNLQSRGDRLVAIYPQEGTLWMDHPLALLEGPWLLSQHRRGFQEMADFFRSAPMQKLAMKEGYRPADLGISLDDSESQISVSNGVDPTQPQTMLQMPTYSVLARVKAVWAILKRPANIYLVADVSGSMAGEKLDKAKEALTSFAEQVVVESDQLALASFSSGVRELVPLAPLSANRAQLIDKIQGLEANGNTALYDSILFAVEKLNQRGDTERINAVLVMTDGRENASRRVLSRSDTRPLIQALDEMKAETEVPVFVFSVAYGDDAELNALERISESTQAQAYQGNPETIGKLYELLSAFFN